MPGLSNQTAIVHPIGRLFGRASRPPWSRLVWFFKSTSGTTTPTEKIEKFEATLHGGYSAQHEFEADHESLRVLVAAGYAAQEAPEAFLRFLETLDETGVDEQSAFGNPSRLQQRIDHYRMLLDSEFAEARERGGRTSREAFLHAIEGLLPRRNKEMTLER